MPSGPHVCPRCHERVSAFAAGCALCGADLDPHRAQRPVPLAQRAVSAWRRRSLGRPRVGAPVRHAR